MAKDSENPSDLVEFDEIAERAKRIFEDYLLDVPMETVASRHGVSVSTIYRMAKRLKWRAEREKLSTRHFSGIRKAVGKKLDEQAAFKAAVDANAIQRAPDGRYFRDTEIRVPPGGNAFGLFPPGDGIEQITTEGPRYFIRCYLDDQDLKTLQKSLTRQ